MKMREAKRNTCMPENELANGLPQLHIIYENEGEEKK
jgi:hypothetical protein